jgi:ABC-type phosphate/phosphonate transport system substrate-binding protein
MKANTKVGDKDGLDGKLQIVAGTCNLAEQLTSGKLQLGVFHGHEFAWAKAKEPKLVPMVVIVNDHHDVHAYVVVKKDNPASGIGGLVGKTIDVPKMTKEHCRVFLDANAKDNDRPNPAKFFGKIKESSSVYDGLDDVAQGKTDAVLVDTITLEFFKSIKPAVYEKNLRVLQKSKSYPAPVIAYKEGTFNAATLKILRDGLLKAHESPDGKLLLREWQINRFEPVPANYQEMLNATLKEHPVPESFTKVSRR